MSSLSSGVKIEHSALSAEDIIRRGLNFSRNESRPSRDAAVPPLSPVNTSTPAATNGVMPASGGLVTEILASNSNATAAPTEAAGGDVHLARRISRSSRHQSVEDELWGWFGDDRPLSEVGDSRSLAAAGVGGGYYSSTDRLFSRVSSGGRMGRAAGVSLLEDGGGNRGDAAEVTVSTTALTERLAKLSAGRALLDHVRAESRALADLVSSAARRALSGDGEGENVAAAAAALAVAAASEGTAIVRRVSISLPPVTVMPRSTAVRKPAEAEAGESAVEEQVIAVAEQGHSPPVSLSPRRLSSSGHPGGACGQTVSAEEQRGAVIRTEDGREQGLEAVAEEPAWLIESVAQPPGGEEDARPCSSEQEVGVHVEREQQKTLHEDVGEEGGIVFAQAIRQRVVDARAELERLQRDIRRLAREGEAAREKVTPLVDRRAELAKAAITDARLVAQRLQEVADAQRVRRR